VSQCGDNNLPVAFEDVLSKLINFSVATQSFALAVYDVVGGKHALWRNFVSQSRISNGMNKNLTGCVS
jgi:hypothetical protein